jgi:hypothetical protein
VPPVRPQARVFVAPVLDALCILVFVLIGRGSHEINQGVGWFVTVLWPLYLGWFSVALATKLYTRPSGTWRALLVTWLGGIAVASFFRGAFTPRPYVSVFTLIAIAFIGLTTFGWRAIGAGIVRFRRREASRAA